MFEYSGRTVQLISRSDSGRGQAGSDPCERISVDPVQYEAFAAGSELDSAADNLAPAPAVQVVVAEAPDDSV
jgi:hypothetical protein